MVQLDGNYNDVVVITIILYVGNQDNNVVVTTMVHVVDCHNENVMVHHSTYCR